MSTRRHGFGCALGLILTLVVVTVWASPALAQASFKKITDFPAFEGTSTQAALVQGADGAFYGTSLRGGANSCNCGTVYKADRYGVIVVLHSFNNANGAYPYGGLVADASGNFYGTASSGGAYGNGVIFKITPDGTYTLLHALNNQANPRHGSNPSAALALGSDGNFYGTARYGGTYGAGTIFRITPGGVLSVLHALNDGMGEGHDPRGGLVEAASDGRLYSTTTGGGAHQNGTIVGVDRFSGTLTVVHAFAGAVGSQYPEGRGLRSWMVEGSDRKLWGTSPQGGSADGGTIFTYDPATHSFSTVHHMAPFSAGRYPDGFYPAGLTLATDGNLYGVTSNGGALNGGTIFRITPGGTFSIVHAFDNSLGEGVSPIGELVQAADGRLYGTNTLGWPTGGGVLFSVTTDGSNYEVLHVFSATPMNPWANAIKGADGNLYGTSISSGLGTIFRILPDGTHQVLHAFLGSDGWSPQGGLVEGPDGSFFGTTSFGGTHSQGAIYKITADGDFTLLHSFAALDATCGCSPEGYQPRSTLLVASDGNLYGTTFRGGLPGWGFGTAFRITTTGSFSVLHRFGASPRDGRNPYAGLVQGDDGRLFGTTHVGGAGYGTIFALDPAGIHTKLYDFKYSDGFNPYAPLTVGPEGSLYGLAYRGGSTDSGTVFRFNPASNSFTMLASFTGVAGGRWPVGGLVIGSEGAVYGTTHRGGAFDRGTFFRLNPDGSGMTVLASFTNSTAGATGGLYEPRSTPFETVPGTFIGTTYLGGSAGRGGVYQLTVVPSTSR